MPPLLVLRAAIITVTLVARPAHNNKAPILARVKTIWPLTINNSGGVIAANINKDFISLYLFS